MSGDIVTRCIREWLTTLLDNSTSSIIYLHGKGMFETFCIYIQNNPDIKINYNVFLRKLNNLEAVLSNLCKDVACDRFGKRIFTYTLTKNTSNKPQPTTLPLNTSPHNTRRHTHQPKRYRHDTTINQTTISDNSYLTGNSRKYDISSMRFGQRQEVLTDNHHNQVIPVSPGNGDLQPVRHSFTTTTSTSTSSTTKSSFPMLSHYSIPTDFTNQQTFQTIKTILRELEIICKEHSDLAFVRLNNTHVKPYFFPNKLTSQKSYDNWERRGFGIKSVLEYMSNGNICEVTEEPTVVKFAMKNIIAKYPRTFENVANKHNFHIISRMSNIETASILSDLGVADKNIMSKLQRHLKVKLHGTNIFSTTKSLELLTEELPKLECKTLLCEKVDNTKKEQVGLASIHIDESFTIDMNRYLNTIVTPEKLDLDNPYDPLYGYSIKKIHTGVYIMFGTDHGQGTSQFLFRTLLLDSEQRRLNDRADYGTRTISYATIQCKKDTYDIIKLTSDLTNEGIKCLETSMLIALIDSKGKIKTMFVDNKSSSIVIKNNYVEVISGQDKITYNIPSGLLPGRIIFKCIIKKFHVIQVGDLAAQMTLQGRDGMASCRCIKCDLTITEWKEGLRGNLLKHSDLQTGSNLLVGQKRSQLWSICPSNCIVPILHCQIGTVNDQLFKKLFRQILTIDAGSTEELDKRLEIIELGDSIADLNESLLHLCTDLEVTKSILIPQRVNLLKKKTASKRRIRVQEKLKTNDPSDRNYLHVQYSIIQSVTKEIATIDKQINSLSSDLNSLRLTIEDEKLNQENIIAEVTALQWDRRKKDVSIHTKVENIFQNHGVIIQAYHGGSLTGGAIIKLLNNHDAIMDDITTLCVETINSRKGDDSVLPPPSLEVFLPILNLHRQLFKAQDAVYANLRLINPTEDEKLQTRERISIMEKKWTKMELSCTPKAHLIFVHAADDQDIFDGLGDKIEDPLEKRHQVQVKLNLILNKMKCGFVRRMHTQLKYEWRNNNPLVLQHIEHVKELTGRKRLHTPISLKTERDAIAKQERHDTRDANMDVINSS